MDFPTVLFITHVSVVDKEFLKQQKQSSLSGNMQYYNNRQLIISSLFKPFQFVSRNWILQNKCAELDTEVLPTVKHNLVTQFVKRLTVFILQEDMCIAE